MSEYEQTPVTIEEKPQKRRGRLRYAAPLGFLVLLLACIGAVSVIVGAVQLVIRMADDTPLREELYDFLDPVMQFCPSDFTDASEDEQNALLLSSVYRVAEAERIRQLREKDDTCSYELDETGWRMQIPQSVIEESFAFLFGDKQPNHQSVGEIEYVADKKVYYVPLTINTSGYTPVLGSIKKKSDTYTVQVTYVANADIEIDEKGNSIPPSFSMGKYTQLYTVSRGEDDALTLLSVESVD